MRWLSDSVPMLKGTYGDTPIFVFDSGVPGGSVLYCGGTHPYEPATSLSAYILKIGKSTRLNSSHAR